MRLIDADALSEKLCKTTIFIKGGEIFQRMINDAPTVSAEAEWIPVIEKLPEEAGYYLVTRKYPQKNEVCVDIDDYSPQERGHGLTGWFEAMLDDEWTAHNIAWRPLPEPYKEGTDAQDKID